MAALLMARPLLILQPLFVVVASAVATLFVVAKDGGVA